MELLLEFDQLRAGVGRPCTLRRGRRGGARRQTLELVKGRGEVRVEAGGGRGAFQTQLTSADLTWPVDNVGVTVVYVANRINMQCLGCSNVLYSPLGYFYV